MKRMIAVLMATLMLTGVLTACSGTIGMDDGQAYGNVSTTPDGRVNGGGYANNGSTSSNGSYGNGNSANGGMFGGNTNGGMFGGNANSGTGMTGGR